MSLKTTIIYGSVRSSRQGIKGAKFIFNKCIEKGWEANLIDPLEYDLPLIDKMHKEYNEGEAPENLEKLSQILKSSDAFIVVTAEYNHSIPPALTNLMNYFQNEYFFKPAGISSYSAGSFGGIRAAVQLRAFLGELGMTTIPIMFAMGKVGSSFNDEGKAIDEAYNRRIKKFLDELEWHAEALKKARENGTPY